MPPRRACDVCAKRKIQCVIPKSGASCEWCEHQGIPCTFVREAKRKRGDELSPDALHGLLRRVRQLEDDLARRSACDRIPDPSSPDSTCAESGTIEQERSSPCGPLPTFRGVPFSPNVLGLSGDSRGIRSADSHAGPGTQCSLRHYLGQKWYSRGMNILSQAGRVWVHSKTGQDDALEKFTLFESTPNSSMAPLQHSHLSIDSISDLPPESFIRKAADILPRTGGNFLGILLDRNLLDDTFMRAYRSPSHTALSYSQLSANACVWALCAVASLSKEARALSESWRGYEHAEKAQFCLGDLTKEPTLDNLQAILMLQVYRRSIGELQSAYLLHSLACRMVCELGGHTNQFETPNFPDQPLIRRQLSHARRLFWGCFTLDKDIALRSDKPPLLIGDFCDLTLPHDFSPPNQSEMVNGSMAGDPFCHLPMDLHLSLIKERIFRLLYSPQSIVTSDSPLLTNIRHLDDELEQWRQSISPDLRPRLFVTPDHPLLPPRLSMLQRIRHIDLQLDHHYTLIAIHTAVRRTGAGTSENEDLPDDLHSVIHSSVDITLEAGRSTLLFLKAAIEVLQEDAIYHIISYAPVSVMSLFVNVLIHPLNPRASSDVAELVTAVGVIQGIPLAELSTNDIKKLQELNDFIMELVRLGNCAIWKAKRENKQANW